MTNSLSAVSAWWKVLEKALEDGLLGASWSVLGAFLQEGGALVFHWLLFGRNQRTVPKPEAYFSKSYVNYYARNSIASPISRGFFTKCSVSWHLKKTGKEAIGVRSGVSLVTIWRK